MWMIKAIIIVCVISTLTSAQKKKVLQTGDGCRLENKKKGICRPFAECVAAVKEVAENDKWPLLCQYSGDASTSIVCCDELDESDDVEPETTKSPTTTTTSTTTTRRPSTPPRTGGNQWLPSGIISRQKCEEYSRWMKIPTLSLSDDDERIPGKCGAYVETFIYGGEEAERLEFPHMAHLGFTNGGDDDIPDWSCGGSLISENFVLTAAHCLRKKDGSNVTHVRLGSGDKRSEIIVKVAQAMAHPNYERNRVYNDIALLRLENNVKFTDYRRPACLQANRNFAQKDGLASGWGATENSRAGSRKLLKVKLPFLSYANCSKSYVADPFNLNLGLDDKTMICAGTLDSGKDTCKGDSGGPLQILLKLPHCMYSVVGVTSFGIKCGIAPGVYTRVSAFVPWIESNVWPK